MQKVGIR